MADFVIDTAVTPPGMTSRTGQSGLNGREPMLKILLRASLAVFVIFGGAFAASAQTGQTAFGQTTAEPAINDANGSTI
jgi:hypothetical protein